MKLHDLIRQYREEHDYSQRQFASMCGLSNGYISMIENNMNPKTNQPIKPTLDKLQKISSGLGMSLSELFEVIDDIPISLADRKIVNHNNECLSEIESIFIQLDERDQEVVLSMARSLLQADRYQQKKGGAHSA